MIDHVGIQCQDVPIAAAFYDTVLAPLGGKRMLDYGVAIGYGTGHPDFWIGELADGVNLRRLRPRPRRQQRGSLLPRT